jgi:hypothetical protein
LSRRYLESLGKEEILKMLDSLEDCGDHWSAGVEGCEGGTETIARIAGFICNRKAPCFVGAIAV